MARNYITINGKVDKAPKVNPDKSVSLVFKIKNDDIQDFPELKKVRTSYCVVRVSQAKWEKVKHHAKGELTIGGFAGANLNSSGTPYLEVVAAYIVPDKDMQTKRVNPKWEKEGQVKKIKVADIVLESDAHLETMKITIDGVVLKKVNASKQINTPICVRPIGNGKYDLTIGLNRYITAKILNLDEMDCVVSELDRIELGKKYGLDKLGKYNKKPNYGKQGKPNNKKPYKPKGDTKKRPYNPKTDNPNKANKKK